MNITEYLDKQPKSLLIVLAFVLVILVGIADYAIGREISYSLFYLLPITLVSWHVSRNAGVLLCIVSSEAWFMADYLAGHSYSHPVIPYWNMSMRLGFFLVVAVILSRLRIAFELEKTLSRTDPLTGVANKRAFYDLASIEIDRARRYKHPFTAAYIDIDNFKTINDRFGHSIGDTLLQLVAITIKNKIRATDTIVRLGGDEFIVLLPETGDEPAYKALYRLRNQLLDVMHKNEWHVTFSIGVATFISPPDSVEEMIKKADNLMYSAKNSGKNIIKQEVFR